jgi:hypothetical protein
MQGLGIGASLAMYNHSGDESFVSNAVLAARFLVLNQTVVTSSGTRVFTDGSSCSDPTCAQFKGIAFRYLSRVDCVFFLDTSRIHSCLVCCGAVVLPSL